MEVVIFCGIQATGKSTFFKQHFFNTHVRISLDLLRTRNREHKLINVCFETQQPFVVENTNPTKQDRAKYIEQAKLHKDCKIIGYYFRSAINDSIERNALREGKERIPELGIRSAYSKLEIPSYDEGFDKLYFVEIKDNKLTINDWEE